MPIDTAVLEAKVGGLSFLGHPGWNWKDLVSKTSNQTIFIALVSVNWELRCCLGQCYDLQSLMELQLSCCPSHLKLGTRILLHAYSCGCGLEASVPSYMAFPKHCQSVIVTCLTAPRISGPRECKYNVHHNLVSEIMYCHFWCILLVVKVNSITVWEGTVDIRRDGSFGGRLEGNYHTTSLLYIFGSVLQNTTLGNQKKFYVKLF